MSVIQDLTVTVTSESRSRTVTAAELAAGLGLDPGTVRGALLAALLARAPPLPLHSNQAVKEGVGGDREPTRSGTRQRVPEKYKSVQRVTRGRGSGGNQDGELEGRALELADRLHDQASLAWYRRVVHDVDGAIVQDALIRALDLDPRRTRRSRAALFTHIIRPHLPARPQRHHAPPPAPTP